MKKLFCLACFISVVALFVSSSAFSQEIPNVRYEAGFTVSDFEYEEPGLMKNTGIMAGIAGSVSYREEWYWAFEGNLSFGQVDYTSATTGSSEDEDNYLAEIRALGGIELVNAEINTPSWSLVPFTGIAYRYLNNDSAGKVTTAGYYGYERESNYVYSPVGIELTKYFGKDGRGFHAEGWWIGARAEYDLFWWGRQISRLSDVNPAFSDLRNTQTDGYGARGSIKIRKTSEEVNIVFEPFITYWNIKKSKEQDIFYAGTIWGYGYEPKNETTEIGVKVSVEF